MNAGSRWDDSHDYPSRDIGQVPELVGHYIGTTYRPVQCSLIDHREHLRWIIPLQDRLPSQPR